MANRDDIFGSLGTPDWTAASGSNTDAFTDSSAINDSSSVIFALRDVEVPSSPQGILIESGATGDGMALSFDGTTGDLVGAAGQGSTTASDGNTAFATLPKAVVAGKTVDIYWCIRPSAVGRVKIYAFDHATGDFLGLAYGETTDGSTLGTQDAEGDWTGADTVGVGRVASGVRSGVDSANFNGTLNLGAEAWNATLPSDFDDDGWTHDTAASLSASGSVSALSAPRRGVVASLAASGSVSASAFRWDDSFVGYGAGPYGALSYGTPRSVTALAPDTSLGAAGILSVIAGGVRYSTSALNGAGSLSVSALKNTTGAANLSASGVLTAAAGRVSVATGQLNGVGSAAFAASKIGAGIATLSGVGSLAGQAVGLRLVNTALLASGTLSADYTRVKNDAAVAIAGAGTISTVALRVGLAEAALSGQGLATATADRSRYVAAALLAAGTVSTSASRARYRSASVVSTGALSAVALRVGIGASLYGGTGSLTATAGKLAPADAALLASGTVSTDASKIAYLTPTLTAVGTITPVAGGIRYRSAALLGSGGQLTVGRLVWTPITADTATWTATTPSLPTWSDVAAGTETWTELQAAA